MVGGSGSTGGARAVIEEESHGVGNEAGQRAALTAARITQRCNLIQSQWHSDDVP